MPKPFLYSIAAALVCLFCAQAHAEPVFGDLYNLRQPDGSFVATRIWGDEYYQVVESLDGYTLLRDPQTQAICYAALAPDGNALISTQVPVDKPTPANLARHLRINSAVARTLATSAREAAAAKEKNELLKANLKRNKATPSTGNVRGLCLLVDFPDEAGTIPPADVDNFCNQIGYTGYGNNGSVRDFYYAASDGLLTYTNDVQPVYYTATYPKSHYDDPTIDEDGPGQELLLEVLASLQNSGFDFTPYDADGDTFIDAINLFYAGYTASGWSKGLWPHTTAYIAPVGTVFTYKYQITDMEDSLIIGTFCHENGHMLFGWPDLYDTGYESNGIGSYCLMAYHGTTNPVTPNPYLKYLAGWTNTTTITSPETGLAAPYGVNTFLRFLNPDAATESYFVANLQQTGRGADYPDAGLSIWHIDANGSNDNEEMTPALHYKVALVQADGRADMEHGVNYGDATDLFDSTYNSACGPTTTPDTNWWNGNASNIDIHNISASGPTMTFDIGDIRLVIDPAGAFVATGPTGGPFTPASVSYTLSNTMDALPEWTAAVDQPWVLLSKNGGGQTGTDATDISIDQAQAALLPAGAYHARVIFTNTALGLDQVRDINLQIMPLDHFVISTISSPQDPASMLDITITAVDSAGDTVQSFDGNVTLTFFKAATQLGGPVAFGPFNNGAASAPVLLPGPNATVHINADDDGGHVGSSNNFDIVTPRIITGVSSTHANGAFTVGETIDIQVAYTAPVKVAGTPQLELATGPVNRRADYTGGTGTATLNFRYVVAAGDTSSDLNYTGVAALLMPSGAAIKDTLTNRYNASLVLPDPGAANSLGGSNDIIIDTSQPALAIGAPSSMLTRTGPVTYTITYTDASNITLSPADIVFAPGGPTAQADISDVDADTKLVTLSNFTGDGNLLFTIAAGTASDDAGNLAPASGSSPQITIDDTPPVIALNGDAIMYFDCGTTHWIDPGATAIDAREGNLTAQITVQGDGITDGNQIVVTYSVADSLGNSADEVRTVKVNPACPATSLTVDGNQDHLISLSELLRVIQFYNSAGFHCDAGTEDGYAPGPGATSCAIMNSDYNPQDWRIDLSELLRVVQFFNSGGYHACAGSEDGFCPGL